jgi:NADPH-dependent 2,4-dienoyl-CoA reductase/sulfur reductase-like enzyme
LSQEEARREGLEASTVECSIQDHKAYYPGATELQIRLTGDRRSGALLGAQLLGAWGSEVSKRLDIYATAMFHGMRVDQLSDLDLSYTPPLSSPWDPVQIAAQAWSAHCKTPRQQGGQRRG